MCDYQDYTTKNKKEGQCLMNLKFINYNLKKCTLKNLQKVIVRDNWLPSPNLIIILEDWNYMGELKKEMEELSFT